MTYLSSSQASTPSRVYYTVPYPLTYSKPTTSLLQGLCTKILFPTSDGPQWEEKRIELQKEFQAQRLSLKSPDGSQLDGMLFPSTSKEAELSKKAILFAPGADGFYEDNFSNYFVNLIKQQVGDINILIVNYPVMASQGELSLESMKFTVFSGCCFLVNELHIRPEDFIVYGQSLGGVASIKGSSLFQQIYPDANMNMINERSFVNLTAIIQNGGGSVWGTIGRKLFEFNDWQTTGVEQDFNNFRGQKFVIYSKYDGLVGKSNSLYKHLKTIPLTTDVKVLFMEGSQIQFQEHLRKFYANEERAICQEMSHMLRLPKASDSTALPTIKTLKFS